VIIIEEDNSGDDDNDNDGDSNGATIVPV